MRHCEIRMNILPHSAIVRTMLVRVQELTGDTARYFQGNPGCIHPGPLFADLPPPRQNRVLDQGFFWSCRSRVLLNLRIPSLGVMLYEAASDVIQGAYASITRICSVGLFPRSTREWYGNPCAAPAACGVLQVSLGEPPTMDISQGCWVNLSYELLI